MSNFDKVETFMKTFGQNVRYSPTLGTPEEQKLRIELIEEELQELKDAIADGDLVEIADALTDILYVTYGAGHTFGLDLDACFDEVQSSNMSKLGNDGKPIYREDGKVMKGPGYFEPELGSIIFKL